MKDFIYEYQIPDQLCDDLIKLHSEIPWLSDEVIKDELTGVTAYKKFTVSSSSYGSSLRHKSISFNGDSEMVAFNF